MRVGGLGAKLLSSTDLLDLWEGGMARLRRRLIGIGVAVTIATSVCGWFLFGRYNGEPLLCFAPPDQVAMIGTFEHDPLYSVAPEDGRLKEEKATTYECDNGHGGSPLSPAFAQATRLYATSAVYSEAQMHQRFDQAARSSGWSIYEEQTQGEGIASYVYVRYCKPFGERVADAWIQSRYGFGPEVEVSLDGRVDGSTCSKS
jgi:hypothetical protein